MTMTGKLLRRELRDRAAAGRRRQRAPRGRGAGP